MDDITYCASDCEYINCKRNKANIKDHSVLHSWCIPEDIPDCPLNKGNNKGGEAMKWHWKDELFVYLLIGTIVIELAVCWMINKWL